MDIGTIIYNRRKELGLTLEQVGNYVGVGKSTVKKWESGFIANIKRDKIAKLAKVLQLNPVTFINGVVQTEEKTPSPSSHRETLTVYSFEGKNGLGTAEQELDLTKLKPLRKLHDAASKLTPEQIERLADLAKDMK